MTTHCLYLSCRVDFRDVEVVGAVSQSVKELMQNSYT